MSEPLTTTTTTEGGGDDSLEDLARSVVESGNEQQKDNLLLKFGRRLDRIEEKIEDEKEQREQMVQENRVAVEQKIANTNSRVTKLEDIKDITRVESDISRLERVLLGVDDEESVTTRSGERALVIARNFTMWSDDGAKGRTINSGRLKPLLETKLNADDDEIQTVQVQRAMKACADMAGEKMTYRDAPGDRGKVLIQEQEVYWDEKTLEDAVSDE